MFKPFELSGTMSFIHSLRNSSIFPSQQDIPEWIIYNVPDGFWLLAFFLLMEYVWNGDVYYCIKQVFCIVISITIISWELLQYIGVMPGTWDEGDMFAYLAAIIFYYSIKKVL